MKTGVNSKINENVDEWIKNLLIFNRVAKSLILDEWMTNEYFKKYVNKVRKNIKKHL